jgi:hypothetical protein
MRQTSAALYRIEELSAEREARIGVLTNAGPLLPLKTRASGAARPPGGTRKPHLDQPRQVLYGARNG